MVEISITCHDTRFPTKTPTNQPTSSPSLAPTQKCAAIDVSLVVTVTLDTTADNPSGDETNADQPKLELEQLGGIYIKQADLKNGKDWWLHRSDQPFPGASTGAEIHYDKDKSRWQMEIINHADLGSLELVGPASPNNDDRQFPGLQEYRFPQINPSKS